MKVFLAGNNGRRAIIADKIREGVDNRPFILESFYYIDETLEKLIPYFGDFMLDSGAFTFMTNRKKIIDWEEYTDRYAECIKRNNVNKFFELDIDSVVGYDRVKELRRKLEKQVGKKCIPVWHVNRGIEEYKKLCDEYSYVAIGGIVSKEITKDKYKAFPTMISEAHKRGAKVHGLGFTNLALIPKYHFDSVDSTAWTTGNRFGFVYYFDGKTMQRKSAPEGYRLSKSWDVSVNNYSEWIKFQKYAETNL